MACGRWRRVPAPAASHQQRSRTLDAQNRNPAQNCDPAKAAADPAGRAAHGDGRDGDAGQGADTPARRAIAAGPARAGNAAAGSAGAARQDDRRAGRGREGAAALERVRGGARRLALQGRAGARHLIAGRRDAAAAACRRSIADREARPHARQGCAARGAGRRRRASPARGPRQHLRRRHQIERAELGARAPADRAHHRAAPFAVHQEPAGAPAEPAAAGCVARPRGPVARGQAPPRRLGRRLAVLGEPEEPAGVAAAGRRGAALSSPQDRRRAAEQASAPAQRAAGSDLLRAGAIGCMGRAAARAAGRRHRAADLRRPRRVGAALQPLGPRRGGRSSRASSCSWPSRRWCDRCWRRASRSGGWCRWPIAQARRLAGCSAPLPPSTRSTAR